MYLKNEFVLLRAIEEKDAQLLWKMINDPTIEHYTLSGNYPVSQHQQKQWIENYRNSDSIIRFIVELEGGDAIGMVMLTKIDWKNRSAHIAYKCDLESPARRKGDMRLAVSALLDYAFYELNLHRIEAEILEYNFASQKLMLAMGMTQEGRRRKCVFRSGMYHDVLVMGLLEEEWRQRQKTNG